MSRGGEPSKGELRERSSLPLPGKAVVRGT